MKEDSEIATTSLVSGNVASELEKEENFLAEEIARSEQILKQKNFLFDSTVHGYLDSLFAKKHEAEVIRDELFSLESEKYTFFAETCREYSCSLELLLEWIKLASGSPKQSSSSENEESSATLSSGELQKEVADKLYNKNLDKRIQMKLKQAAQQRKGSFESCVREALSTFKQEALEHFNRHKQLNLGFVKNSIQKWKHIGELERRQERTVRKLDQKYSSLHQRIVAEFFSGENVKQLREWSENFLDTCTFEDDSLEVVNGAMKDVAQFSHDFASVLNIKNTGVDNKKAVQQAEAFVGQIADSRFPSLMRYLSTLQHLQELGMPSNVASKLQKINQRLFNRFYDKEKEHVTEDQQSQALQADNTNTDFTKAEYLDELFTRLSNSGVADLRLRYCLVVHTHRQLALCVDLFGYSKRFESKSGVEIQDKNPFHALWVDEELSRFVECKLESVPVRIQSKLLVNESAWLYNKWQHCRQFNIKVLLRYKSILKQSLRQTKSQRSNALFGLFHPSTPDFQQGVFKSLLVTLHKQQQELATLLKIYSAAVQNYKVGDIMLAKQIISPFQLQFPAIVVNILTHFTSFHRFIKPGDTALVRINDRHEPDEDAAFTLTDEESTSKTSREEFSIFKRQGVPAFMVSRYILKTQKSQTPAVAARHNYLVMNEQELSTQLSQYFVKTDVSEVSLSKFIETNSHADTQLQDFIAGFHNALLPSPSNSLQAKQRAIWEMLHYIQKYCALRNSSNPASQFEKILDNALTAYSGILDNRIKKLQEEPDSFWCKMYIDHVTSPSESVSENLCPTSTFTSSILSHCSITRVEEEPQEEDDGDEQEELPNARAYQKLIDDIYRKTEHPIELIMQLRWHGNLLEQQNSSDHVYLKMRRQIQEEKKDMAQFKTRLQDVNRLAFLKILDHEGTRIWIPPMRTICSYLSNQIVTCLCSESILNKSTFTKAMKIRMNVEPFIAEMRRNVIKSVKRQQQHQITSNVICSKLNSLALHAKQMWLELSCYMPLVQLYWIAGIQASADQIDNRAFEESRRRLFSEFLSQILEILKGLEITSLQLVLTSAAPPVVSKTQFQHLPQLLAERYFGVEATEALQKEPSLTEFLFRQVYAIDSKTLQVLAALKDAVLYAILHYQ